MNRSARAAQPYPRVWRLFSARERTTIADSLSRGQPPCCPGCGDPLEARFESRSARSLPLGATAFDLDCRPCRRFWTVVRHTERSLRLLRMRRFVAALRAVELAPSGGGARSPAAG